ncbi:hypothetical protein [Bradyrhizobium sp. SZCCHNPS1003]|uniref:hypothetical protein n=1 Tax=Bradyrhizobium sp. SZCCHNPS1003 TaxID=3057330 RepID=UPI0028E44AFE|nr:hypothetical protein [Bradyrhizobium sp. SZCCHNPS1003]
MTEASDKLWKDLCGFTPPSCPVCARTAVLDEDGYYCEWCGDPAHPNPAVDDIPNGAEFDEILERYKAARS